MSITNPCTGTFEPMRGLWRTSSAPRMTFCRSLAHRPKYSFKFSGSFARSTPNARNPSVSFITVVLQTRQSVWPMRAISLPPLTAQARASERTVLLSGPVMMFPALRSQMNCSSGSPSISGISRFRRGSMQVSATSGSASANSDAFRSASVPPPPVRWFASMMASRRRMSYLSSFVVVLAHRPLQRGNLLKQLLKLHAGQALQHRRQLADDLHHVARDFTCAPAGAVAVVNDDHPLGFGERFADLARDLRQHAHNQFDDRRLVVLLERFGLLLHRLGLRPPLRLDDGRLRQTARLVRFRLGQTGGFGHVRARKTGRLGRRRPAGRLGFELEFLRVGQ